MTRITPRTCLYPLAASLVVAFALSISLTFRSNHHCYAATCGEWLFPLQARLHVAVWYSWLSLFVTFLAVRAFSPELRRFLRLPVPGLEKYVSVSGLLVGVWVVVLYGALIGVWWWRLRDYFVARGHEGGVEKGNGTLAAIALLGHLCDVTLGMVLVPISRHSALASFFSLSVSTTLKFHMATAYTLFGLVIVHGFLYVSWVPTFNALSAQLRMVFPVLNPTYLYHETWPGDTSALGVWRASLIFSGVLTTAIMALIAVTTVPVVRRKHFDLFYYTHLLIIPGVIIICLHASTIFYCAAPGLLMWVLDWGMRLYELRRKLDGKISIVGNGWYCLTLLLPRHRLDGCACTSPLAHFYLYHSGSSVRQLHPFTTITHLASQNAATPLSEDDFLICFLFRKQGRTNQNPELSTLGNRFTFLKYFRRRGTASPAEWTDRLASLADKAALTTDSSLHRDEAIIDPEGPFTMLTSPTAWINTAHAAIGVRAEGPYFTPADPARYHTVVCIVAGTGISGALAIISAFAAQKTRDARNAAETDMCAPGTCSAVQEPVPVPVGGRRMWERCVVVWSVREADYIALPALTDHGISNLEVQVHLTGNGRPRLDIVKTLADVREGENKTWVYLSGPNEFIQAGEVACRASEGVEWFGARWSI
ncbi:hypothetical protein VE02_05898 [Pseudogymnoascus sp. 03VT05]|nr:hypothetical protein VE02_05898 [Pseudogymnoascus sp. 03VT05]